MNNASERMMYVEVVPLHILCGTEECREKIKCGGQFEFLTRDLPNQKQKRGSHESDSAARS